MRSYVRSISAFFRWSHRDSLFLLTEEQFQALAVEAIVSLAVWR